MTKYIDADAEREDFMAAIYEELQSDPYNNRANRIIDLFDNFPAAPVRPEVHARWEKRSFCGWVFYKCTACGETISGYPMYKFCHSCGATMDAEGEKA